MSSSKTGSPTTESPVVPGLTTPYLNSGELTKNQSNREQEQTSEINQSEKNGVSVFDIASDLKKQLKIIGDNVNTQDEEMNTKIDVLLNKIKKLQEKAAS